jgi:hypothetical protein
MCVKVTHGDFLDKILRQSLLLFVLMSGVGLLLCCFHSGSVGWGQPRSLCPFHHFLLWVSVDRNLQRTVQLRGWILCDDIITQPDRHHTPFLISDNSDFFCAICKGWQWNCGEHTRIVALCVHFLIYETSGSHSTDDINVGLLGCNAVWACSEIATFQWYILSRGCGCVLTSLHSFF